MLAVVVAGAAVSAVGEEGRNAADRPGMILTPTVLVRFLARGLLRPRIAGVAAARARTIHDRLLRLDGDVEVPVTIATETAADLVAVVGDIVREYHQGLGLPARDDVTPTGLVVIAINAIKVEVARTDR